MKARDFNKILRSRHQTVARHNGFQLGFPIGIMTHEQRGAFIAILLIFVRLHRCANRCSKFTGAVSAVITITQTKSRSRLRLRLVPPQRHLKRFLACGLGFRPAGLGGGGNACPAFCAHPALLLGGRTSRCLDHRLGGFDLGPARPLSGGDFCLASSTHTALFLGSLGDGRLGGH